MLLSSEFFYAYHSYLDNSKFVNCLDYILVTADVSSLLEHSALN